MIVLQLLKLLVVIGLLGVIVFNGIFPILIGKKPFSWFRKATEEEKKEAKEKKEEAITKQDIKLRLDRAKKELKDIERQLKSRMAENDGVRAELREQKEVLEELIESTQQELKKIS